MEFARKLSALIGLRGLSHAQLALKSGVSRRHIAMILSGQRAPSLRVATALAQALEVSLDWLVGIPQENSGQLMPEEAELLRDYRAIRERSVKYLVPKPPRLSQL